MQKPRKRVVDIGFGDGRHLEHLQATTDHILSGVEHRRARKTSIPGVELSYDGFSSWLKKTPDKSADHVILHFFVGDYCREHRTQPEDLLKSVREKLSENGTVEFMEPVGADRSFSYFEEKFRDIFSMGGFKVTEIRPATSEDLRKTEWSERWDRDRRVEVLHLEAQKSDLPTGQQAPSKSTFHRHH